MSERKFDPRNMTWPAEEKRDDGLERDGGWHLGRVLATREELKRFLSAFGYDEGLADDVTDEDLR